MDPRYPVGTFEMPTQVTPSKRQLAIDELAATPTKLRAFISTPLSFSRPLRNEREKPARVVHQDAM